MVKRMLPPPRKTSFLLRVLYELADVGCSAVFALALMLTFVIRPIGVEGLSMLPTLQHEQIIIVSVYPGELRYGHIVVVSEAAMAESQNFVKRVIGLPGDEIDIDFVAGVVYRNGQALHEPYIIGPTNRSSDVVFPVTVEPGTVFVLGDNRNHSADSRDSHIGLVDQRMIIGRMIWAWPN